MITKESLRILHQKLNFIGTIDRQYDSKFAKKGAKIGSSLDIRLPNEYTVTTGAALGSQDTVEQSVTLNVSTQKHVPLAFTSVDLTMDIDRFSERYIEPAMAVLAASMEADAINMYKDVYQQVNNQGSAGTAAQMLQANKLLTDSLANPAKRCLNNNTQDNVDLVTDLKGLFNDQTNVSKNYREGRVASNTFGFADIMENTHWQNHTVGAGSGYLVNGASQTGAGLIVDTGTGALSAGDVFTIAGVFRVHPETKLSTGILQQFTVTGGYAGGAGTMTISPSIVTSGGRQNVSGSPADNAAITIAGTASTAHGISMAYAKEAFTFATADLELPNGVDFGAREVLDGVSMRIIRDYDINNDNLPCRVDVLYGYKTLRAQLAARIANN